MDSLNLHIPLRIGVYQSADHQYLTNYQKSQQIICNLSEQNNNIVEY